MAGSVALVGMNISSVEASYSAQLAENAGILIQPATTLGYDDQHMRMGFGRIGFTKALEEFEGYLRKN